MYTGETDRCSGVRLRKHNAPLTASPASVSKLEKHEWFVPWQTGEADKTCKANYYVTLMPREEIKKAQW